MEPHFSFTVASIIALLVFCTAIPAYPVLHEEQDLHALDEWEKLDRVEPGAVVPVRVGLTQRNLENGYNYLMDVSDPSSPNYGKHWTSDEVVAKFAPAEETVNAVRSWLESTGINSDRIIHHDNKGWFLLNARADEVERLICAPLYEYEHMHSGVLSIGCEKYYLPAHVRRHVNYITPGVKLSAPLRKRKIGSKSYKQRNIERPSTIPEQPIGSKDDISNCDKVTTPDCIFALYQLPRPDYKEAHPNNTFGFFEQDRYSQGDLDQFFHRFAQNIPNGTHPVLKSVDGGKAPVAKGGAEAALDFQSAYPLVYPQNLILYQVDDYYYTFGNGYKVRSGLFNTWLDAMDGSYCNYSAYGETGDDPRFDPHYPDKHKKGYKGKKMCGVYKPAKVLSVSYGLVEYWLPEYYQKRRCDEFMKLALQGSTIVVSSGDEGVGLIKLRGNRTGCVGPRRNRFAPGQPGGCYAILNVGGTEIKKGNTVHDPEVAVSKPKLHFASGGGFSNIFPRPNYQDEALDTYFKYHRPPYKSYTQFGNNKKQDFPGRYNRLGRGFPDVSAIAANFATYAGGRFSLADGTSGSAPVFAAIIARINEERLRRGKSVVGFINPVIYKHPQIFNDITEGYNPGCHTKGFRAVKGWDPVTGLGTPNYPRMLKLFLSLPCGKS